MCCHGNLFKDDLTKFVKSHVKNTLIHDVYLSKKEYVFYRNWLLY